MDAPYVPAVTNSLPKWNLPPHPFECDLSETRRKKVFISGITTRHPIARDVATVAAQANAANPLMGAAVTLLVGIAGAVCGPTINRALHRDANDRKMSDTAATMLTEWTAEQTGIR
jgi:hypothetical protein